MCKECSKQSLRILKFYLIAMTIVPCLEYYSARGSVFGIVVYRIFSLLTIVFSLFMVIQDHIMSRYRCLVTFYFFIYTLYSVGLMILEYNVLSFFNATILLIIPAAVSFANINISRLYTAFKVICVVSILIFVYIWLSNNIDMAVALRRGYTWTYIFYWGEIFWGIVPIVLYGFICTNEIKFKFLCVIYWACGILFNLIFLKRAIVLDSLLLILMIIVYMLFTKKIKFKSLVEGLMLSLFFILIIIYVQNDKISALWEGIWKRFESINSILEIDRVYETTHYFATANPLSFIIGKGLWGTQSVLKGRLHEALHIGWANFIFKGGIIMFFMALVPTIKAFRMLPRLHLYDKKIQWAICIVCVDAVRLCYVNFYSHTPALLMLFWAYSVIMESKFHKGRINYE